MAFHLAIDIGGTWTTAALARGDRVEPAVLAPGPAPIPSVVFADASGSVVVGQDAIRRGVADPSRAARVIMRRLGDPTPIILGSTSLPPARLVAAMVKAMKDAAEASEGEPAESVALAHPASWGEYRRAVLGEVAVLAGIGGAMTRSSAECAALDFLSSKSPIEGDLIAVYDLGGETFEASAVAWTGRDVTSVGPSTTIDFGGADIDEVVLSQVLSAVGGIVDQLDPSDPDALATMDGLRSACRAAKEALSSDDAAHIPVTLPGARTRVRVTRAELQAAIRPAVSTTVAALGDVINAAPGRVRGVLLVGGASRTPLVTDLVTAELGLPVHLWEPTLAVARGLARSTTHSTSRPLQAAGGSARSTVFVGSQHPSAPTPPRPAPAPTPSGAATIVPTPPPPPTPPDPAPTAAAAAPTTTAPAANPPKLALAVLAGAVVVALVLAATGHPVLAVVMVAIALAVAWSLRAARSRGH